MNAYQRGQKALCGDYFKYTPAGASQFKRAGRWHTKPQAGDVSFYFSWKEIHPVKKETEMAERFVRRDTIILRLHRGHGSADSEDLCMATKLALWRSY